MHTTKGHNRNHPSRRNMTKQKSCFGPTKKPLVLTKNNRQLGWHYLTRLAAFSPFRLPKLRRP